MHIASGDGGNGVVSFRREKFVERGGPDGGDGGRGGHVILRADAQVSSLERWYFQPHQRAEAGGKGSGARKHGRNGEDLVLDVPPGTEAVDEEAGALGEVLEAGETLMLARGGKGGLGNVHFKTSTHQTPRECTPGEEGEERTVRLTLKIISDVGLVGFPNAGKSTLLSRLSAAHPKVAPYPFTTLNPILGTVEVAGYRTVTVADIPGLIEGAHRGVGLGHDFLRHIERTRFLLYVIDMAGVDGRHPADDYLNLREELQQYRTDLVARPYAILANKMDVPGAEERLREFAERCGEGRRLRPARRNAVIALPADLACP